MVFAAMTTATPQVCVLIFTAQSTPDGNRSFWCDQQRRRAYQRPKPPNNNTGQHTKRIPTDRRGHI